MGIYPLEANQPPKNNKTDKDDIKIILEYSPIENNTKPTAEYSDTITSH